MKKTILLTTLALSSFSFAQEEFKALDNNFEPWQPGARSSKFFIGAGYGFASEGAADIADLESEALNVDALTSIEFGFQNKFNDLTLTLSAEILWGDSSSDAIIEDAFAAGSDYTASEESENLGFLVNAKIGYDLPQYVSLYAGLGIGSVTNTYSFEDNLNNSLNAEESVFVWQVTAGLELKPVEQFGVFVQYRYLVGEDFEQTDFTAIDDSFVEVGARFYF